LSIIVPLLYEQLIAEGRINAETSRADIATDVSMPTKRRRQGICFRNGYSGKKIIRIPYRCWQGK